MVAGVGFEPHDFRLMRPAKTTSSLSRYKTGAPGLNRTDYPRVTSPVHRQQCFRGIKLFMVDRERIELSIPGCKPDVFPLALTAHIETHYHKLQVRLRTFCKDNMFQYGRS